MRALFENFEIFILYLSIRFSKMIELQKIFHTNTVKSPKPLKLFRILSSLEYFSLSSLLKNPQYKTRRKIFLLVIHKYLI